MSTSPSSRRRTLVRLIGVAGLVGIGTPAAAQWRASRPIQLVVPFPPGGSMDAVARVLAEPLAAELKQPVLIDNRAGAGSTIAAAFVAKALPDGHTLLVSGPVTHIVSGLTYPNLKYDAVNSFAAVATATQAPLIFVVRPESKTQTLSELVARARQKPGAVSYASSGNGASPHLVAEMLADRVGVKFLHVPYRGVAPALLALLAGDVDFSVADTTALPQIQAGKLIAIAVTTATSSRALPGVPTVAQSEQQGLSGLGGFDEPSTIGLLAPAGTPADTLRTLNTAVNSVLRLPAVYEQMRKLGQEPYGSTAQEFGDALNATLARYGSMVRKLGLTN